MKGLFFPTSYYKEEMYNKDCSREQKYGSPHITGMMVIWKKDKNDHI
jgi:hypothetical protein